MVKKTTVDGSTTYVYDALDRLISITTPDGKTEIFEYNGEGKIISSTDKGGHKTRYILDANGNIIETIDAMGNSALFEYDPMNNLIKTSMHLIDTQDNVDEWEITLYEFDGRGLVTREVNSLGNVTTYIYDGNSNLKSKTDADGKVTAYAYNGLDMITSINYNRGKEVSNYGNKTRTYQYDSLGNLTYETELGNKSIDYKFNNLNQITKKTEDGWKTQNDFTYDRRGNLIRETNTKNGKISVIGEYTYDETNKMVLGVNELGESSAYLYNGLGALVENTWVIKKNAYGYHDVSALTTMVEGEVVVNPQTGKKDKKDKLAPEVVVASSELNKTSTVVKQFVTDYTSDTFEPLMEYEVNSLEYRYIYGNDRLSVNITGIENSSGNIIENGNQIRLYYHMDHLGTADYLTSPITGKVESWTHYNEWGEITHNAVLKCGQRELDMVKRYATHDYDSVLSMYYAKARFYDAQNRRFASIDPILDGSVYNITDYAKDPVQLIQYLYVKNNPVIYIDPDGLRPVIDDLDPYGAYSEKSFDYRYYRQEHKDMFIEGIVSSATAPVHGFDLSQARDYQKKIQKCDNNLISDERTRNADLDFYIQHSPMTEGMANGMYGGNFWSWFFDKAGLLPEGYEAIPYSGEHADLYKNGELLGNSIPVIYGFSEFVVPYLQKMMDKVPYVEGTGNYANYAKTATKNAGSSEVVLGKFNQDGISYVKVAEARGSSYFQLDAWDDVAKTVGEKNMWNINEQFLQQQMVQGKSFVLTHNPYQATGYFSQEVDFLTRNGYKFVQNGSMWNAIK